MKFSEFLPLALRTESTIQDPKVNVPLLEGVLNLAFNITEIADMIKKSSYYGNELDTQRLDSILDAVIMTSAAARLMARQTSQLQADALEQVVRPISDVMDSRYLHSVLGVLTEAGELLKTLGKQKHEMDVVNIQEEVGDIFWYLALLQDTTGVDVEQSMDKVIEKLKVRYPEKFTTEKATQRNLEAERKVLE